MHPWTLALAAAMALAGAAARGERPETACRTCHRASRPIRGDAALAPCARVEAGGGHRPDDGPDHRVMNERGRRYGPVAFAHREHAEMAETGRGCRECHHEATEGRAIEPCDACHRPGRDHVDLETPNLRAALHRQCMGCHRAWDPGMTCGSCHQAVGAVPEHPPGRNGEDAALLRVFYKFHHGMTCVQCHPVAAGSDAPAAACASCHDDWPASFRHATTGLELSADHRDAACEDCHPGGDVAAAPVCADCHDDVSYPDQLPGRRLAPAGGEAAP